MSFVGNLASSPGTSGIYGQGGGGGDNTGEALDLVNRLKDREFQDFKNKANFMSELSVKQDRMRNRFEPMSGMQTPTGDVMPNQGEGPSQRNTVMAPDPNVMTGYQKGELGIRQQGVNLDKQKLAQTGQMGEERIKIQGDAQKLNEDKNKQIYETKQADMQRKTDEANAKIEQAQAALAARVQSGKDAIQAHKDLAKAMEERHKLELDLKDSQFNDIKALHEAQIKKMQEDADRAKTSQTTTELDASGNKKTVTTKRGSAADTIKVIGKDGKPYMIPKDKEDDWNQNHKQDDQEEQ